MGCDHISLAGWARMRRSASRTRHSRRGCSGTAGSRLRRTPTAWNALAGEGASRSRRARTRSRSTCGSTRSDAVTAVSSASRRLMRPRRRRARVRRVPSPLASSVRCTCSTKEAATMTPSSQTKASSPLSLMRARASTPARPQAGARSQRRQRWRRAAHANTMRAAAARAQRQEERAARAHQLAPHRGAAAIGLGRCLGKGGERQNKMKRSNCWSLFTVTPPKLDASVLRELTILCDTGRVSAPRSPVESAGLGRNSSASEVPPGIPN